MLSNSLINAIIYNMSLGNPSVQSKKRFPKNPLILSHDNNSKLKTLPSSSCISNVTTGDLKADTLEDKIILNYCKSSTRISKTVSNANISSRKLWNNTTKTTRSPTPVNGVIEEESEIISTLTKQLHLSQSQIRKMQSVQIKTKEGLRTKDQEIECLKRKIKEWENKYKSQEIVRKKELRNQTNNSEYFYQRCLTLEHRIVEMEKFLTDYGLIWMSDVKNPTNVNGGSNNYVDACYDQLVANIDQLNLTARKGEVHIHHNEKGATFKTSSCMALKFYKNGMTVKGGRLRSYDDPRVISFIRDILDGYFPSELQQEFPDGVPFVIEDHRPELYVGDSASFPGQGYRLGKQSPIDNLLLTDSNRSNNVFQRPSRVSSSPKNNACSYDDIPLLSLPTSRSLKSKSSSGTLSTDLFSLRSQILASHNNACSSSHLQSHINAEMARSSRREKRELATKNIEYDMSTTEQLCKMKDALKPSHSNKTKYHSSSDRSSYSRPETIRSRLRLRSRSVSLSGGRSGVSMQSILRSKALSTAEINNINELKTAGFAAAYFAKYPRVSKSATYARKNIPPVLHQVNEATGKSGELRLKVRSLSGSTVYLIHLFADESIAKLYELLDRAVQTLGHRRYKVILNGYSPKRLESVNASLRECGISRDCVLHLVND